MIASFSIFPIGRGVSVGSEVAKAVKIVEDSGLPYRLTPMGTVIEGSWERVMGVIKRCRDRLRRDNERVYLTISIDDRKGASGRIRKKVESVERRLGQLR